MTIPGPNKVMRGGPALLEAQREAYTCKHNLVNFTQAVFMGEQPENPDYPLHPPNVVGRGLLYLTDDKLDKPNQTAVAPGAVTTASLAAEFAVLGDGPASAREVAMVFAAGYTQIVGGLQYQARSLRRNGNEDIFEAATSMLLLATHASKLRTVANFVLRASEDFQSYSGELLLPVTPSLGVNNFWMGFLEGEPQASIAEPYGALVAASLMPRPQELPSFLPVLRQTTQ